MKSKLSLCILLLLVVGATIGIFTLLTLENIEARNTIYYVNMSICVLVEILSFCAFITTKTSGSTNTQSIAITSRVLKWAFTIISVVILYNVINYFKPELISPIWYYIILIVITVWHTIVFVSTSMGASAQIETAVNTKRISDNKRNIVQGLRTIPNEYLSASQGKGIDNIVLVKSRKSITSVVSNTTSIPSSFFENNIEAFNSIKYGFDELKILINQLDESSDEDLNNEIASVIIKKCNKLSNEVTAAKKL